jgi:hypothetical protein
MARKNAPIVMFSLRDFPGFWPLCFWVFATLGAPGMAAAGAREARRAEAKPVVAVVSVKTPPALDGDRAAIESSVTRGLESAGWKVIGLAETTRLVGKNKTLLGCEGELCAIELAHITKTVYLVWAEANAGKRKYNISLKLLDASDAGKPMTSEHGECSAREVAPKMELAAQLAGHEAITILEELAHPDEVPGGKGPAVALVSVKLPPSVADDRAGIESGLARGLDLAGWQVLRVSETMRLLADRKDLWDCASELCALEIGRLTKAPYLVRSSVKQGKGKYTVSLGLFDTANPGKPIAREEEECFDHDPDCPPVAEKIDRAARTLGRKGIKLVVQDSPTASTAVAHAANAIQPAVPAQVPPPTGIIVPPTDEPKPHSSATRIAGWAAFGGGIALLGGSAVFFIYDGKEHDCQDTPAGRRCFQLYDNKTRAYVMGGIGLASALVGGYIILFSGSAHPTTVALSPRGIFVGGGF